MNAARGRGVCPRLPFVAHASAASLPSLLASPPSETTPSYCACPLTCSHEIAVPLSATHLHASRKTVMMATFGDSRPYGSCRLVAALMVYVESATIKTFCGGGGTAASVLANSCMLAKYIMTCIAAVFSAVLLLRCSAPTYLSSSC